MQLTSEQPGSRFPNFSDGEVNIIITGSRQYQLHKAVLRNSSSLFRNLLSGDHTAILSKKALNKGVVVTNLIRGTVGDEGIELQAIGLDSNGRAVSEGHKTGLDLENGMPVPSIITAFDKVLAAFYHAPIDLSDLSALTLRSILPNALDVLKVAEYLGCVSMVTQHFEATLLALGQDLYRALSRDPQAWIDLAIRMQSKTLYRESMLHAAGQWNTPQISAAYIEFDNQTREILKSMADQIVESVKRSVNLMLSYYPTPLQRMPAQSVVEREENSRNSYANDILHWMALTVFRQWLGHQIADEKTHHADDLGYDFMEMVRAGGERYLGEQELTLWHGYFPMSTRSRHAIEDRVDEIKMHVRQWTRGYFKNHTKLDVKQYPTGYFVCAMFPENVTYPWDAQEEKLEGEEDEKASEAGEEPEIEQEKQEKQEKPEKDKEDSVDEEPKPKRAKLTPKGSGGYAMLFSSAVGGRRPENR